MTLIRHRGFSPHVDPDALVMPTAVVVGRVRIEAETRVLYGAVLDAEGSSIQVGHSCIVSENAVLRATAESEDESPVTLGDHILVGPHATLLGCAVEDGSFIATGATVLHGAIVRPGGVVGVGALVHAKTIIPPEFFVPPNAVAIGDPPQLFGPEEGEAMLEAIKQLGFSKTAFGVDVEGRDRASIYRDVTSTRSREYGAHRDDSIVEPE